MSELTREQFDKSLPKQFKGRVSDEVLEEINELISDSSIRDNFRENLLSYTSVMRDGRFTLDQYISAVKYVSYKLMGATNIEAYTKTFPDRYQRMIDESTPDKHIARYVTAYNKTQLVNLILEQTLVPSHVLNADMYQRAINVQAELMLSAKSEKVRTDAANSLLNHLKTPETKKIELDIGVKEDKTLNDLRDSTMALVAQQKKMIEAGMFGAKDIAESKIIEGEIVE